LTFRPSRTIRPINLFDFLASQPLSKPHLQPITAPLSAEKKPTQINDITHSVQKILTSPPIALRRSMLKGYAAVAVTSCFLAGLLTVSSSVTARAAECLSGPKGESGPGTHWRYRINHTTGQRCWYLKRVGDAARARPSSESPAPSRTTAGGSSEQAAPSEASTEKSAIKAWFSSTFAAFTALGRSVTTSETNEPSANDNSAASKQPNSDRSEQRKSQQSRLEQQPRSTQSKPEKEKSDTARAPSRVAPLLVPILEAAGDKDVPGATTELSDDEKRTAIEAVGEKDVFALETELEEDWQKELYQQFLEWQVKQLMFQASDEKISDSLPTRSN
jgi:flagellar biosynthesis GTPase FlhF